MHIQINKQAGTRKFSSMHRLICTTIADLYHCHMSLSLTHFFTLMFHFFHTFIHSSMILLILIFPLSELTRVCVAQKNKKMTLKSHRRLFFNRSLALTWLWLWLYGTQTWKVSEWEKFLRTECLNVPYVCATSSSFYVHWLLPPFWSSPSSYFVHFVLPVEL